jgi:ATP-dependent helicase/nuclease subunit A
MPKRRSLPDEAARELIETRTDLNLLVEAGAGSGKTESLARRMAAGIADGTYEVEGMAAVTFTRKAAAQIRGRFQLVLETRLGAETDPVRKGRIQAALSHLERLFAGTIHAFCAHLLRERPVEAGIAPGFTELDEDADAEFRRQAWRDYLDRERATGSPVYRELSEAGVQPKDLDDAFATVCRFAEVEFPTGDGPVPDAGPARAGLPDFCARLDRLLPDPIADDTTCGVQQRAREFQGRLQIADLSRPAALAELLAMWETTPKIVQKWWHPDPKQKKAVAGQVQELLARFQEETVVPFLAAWRQYVYRPAMTLVCGGRDFAARARGHAVSLNYEDLLQKAARLLREKTEVRGALQRKYRWLFVDEFQDTDPIQAEVIILLAAAGAAERDWTRVSLRPGALFIVGDPKQSIYRFRRADIDAYNRVRRRIETTGGQVVELTTSFRHVPSLCTWANLAFPAFFPAAATPQQPAFHRLDPVRDEEEAPRCGVRQLPVEATTRVGAATEDAGTIARWIRHAVQSQGYTWGDFLVLTRKKALGTDQNILPIYAQALETLHIPVEVSGGAAFAVSSRVAALAALLRALSDPSDGTALVGVLRGPFFGLSDEELYRHREAGFIFLLTAPIPAEASGPVVEARRTLQGMYRTTRTLPAPAAVERILEETGFLAWALTDTPGGAEAGNLLHAVDRVRQVTEAGRSLADAAQTLEEAIESTEGESIPLEPGRRDVVRLMNLHKAKGLEAPVVFLADPLGGVKPRADVRILREDGHARGYLRITRKIGEFGRRLLAEPAGWAEHEREELAYVEAEERRLLYVASTRAKNLLVVSRCPREGGHSVGAWAPLDPFLADAPELSIPGDMSLPTEATVQATPELSEAARAPREERQRAARQPSWQVESVTGTAHRGTRPGQPPEPGRTREPDTGMAWGNLVHGLLEYAARGPQRGRAHLDRLARWFTMEQPELRAVIPDALEVVERVVASDLWQRAMAAEERLAEVPFAVKVPGDGAPPIILHGVIDLAFRTADGWELVEYKTDQVDLATLVDLYGDQVRQYAKHWAELTGAPVKFAGLYSVREGQVTRNLIPDIAVGPQRTQSTQRTP